VRLRREERIENAVGVFCIDPRTGIFNRNDHFVGRAGLGPYCELARTDWHCVHRFAGVHDKIEHDLLQLHAVGRDRRELSTEFGAN
jgi:hypothetical protein